VLGFFLLELKGGSASKGKGDVNYGTVGEEVGSWTKEEEFGSE
jgi:hypothetical protein